MNNDFIRALSALEIEKGLNAELIIEAVEAALKSAYKKNYNTNENIEIRIDRKTGSIAILSFKTIVDEVVDDSLEISLADVSDYFPGKTFSIGDTVEILVEPKSFGRIAAQTARQVVASKLREAEKELIYKQYDNNKREIVSGIIESIDNGNYIIDIDKTKAILPLQGQIPNEEFKIGDRIKAYIVGAVNPRKNEPQVILSRNNNEFLLRLFELEIPEIKNGEVLIKSISREAGSRSKVAVSSQTLSIDPIGSCIGEDGLRIRAIVDELNGEKIDIVLWNEDPEIYISSSLSPSQIIDVQTIDDETAQKMNKALVIVPDDQLSLSIGKEGQNVRLAAKLTGWKIDIKSQSQADENAINYTFKFVNKG